jgi:hypothetical protein
MKAVHKDRPNEFQHPGGVKGRVEQSYLLEGKTAIAKNDRYSVAKKSVWNSLGKVKAAYD